MYHCLVGIRGNRVAPKDIMASKPKITNPIMRNKRLDKLIVFAMKIKIEPKNFLKFAREDNNYLNILFGGMKHCKLMLQSAGNCRTFF